MNANHFLSDAGVQVTPNRILVWRELERASSPLSLRELEDSIDTMDKSSIFRTLRLFADHHLVHQIDDGSGSIKFEVCHLRTHNTLHDDEHAHFYCRQCHKTFCLDNIPVPHITLPEGFHTEETNFVFKGICPTCSEK